MASADGVRISVAIMHHPNRAGRIPALIQACAPIVPRLVTDPRPDGPPSALRTAKLAWAAISDGATHHLVLQDDVLPMHGFAEHLYRAVASQPAHGVTLYVHWKSPYNAYLVRRAAMAALPWARLHPDEWTPTLGLVLPVAHARGLAAYLSTLPDELLEDDDFVSTFCSANGVRVLATVPHLVEHDEGPSLCGYDCEGDRLATVYDHHWPIPASHWAKVSGGAQSGATPSAGHAIELRESRCVIRISRPGTDEPLESPYGWYWHDWSALIGVDPDRIVRDYDDARWPSTNPDVPRRLAIEVWAAGYLLGADLPLPPEPAADLPLPPEPATAIEPLQLAMPTQTIRAWLDCGLRAADRSAIVGPQRAGLARLCIDAVRAGSLGRYGHEPALVRAR